MIQPINTRKTNLHLGIVQRMWRNEVYCIFNEKNHDFFV